MKRILRISLVLIGLSIALQTPGANAKCSTSSTINDRGSHCSVKVESLGCSSNLIARCNVQTPQNEYIHSESLFEVKADSSLYRAVEAIPFAGEVVADTAHKAALQDWLYNFLVAFSAAGNDSLVAAFYTQDVEENARVESFQHLYLLEKLKDKWNKEIGRSREDEPSLFEVLREGHNYLLYKDERDYYIEQVSFRESTFRLFEMEEEYESYLAYIEDQKWLPTGHWTADLSIQQAVAKRIKGGQTLIFAEIGFVVQEPVAFSTSLTPRWTPFFFRMAWNDEQQRWQLVELALGVDIPHGFLFGFL